MPSVLAIISKAIFEKMVPKSVKVGDPVATDHYLSQVKALEPLKEGGSLFLVTVRPPNERLWLATILEQPRFKKDGWYAKANSTPIADVTSAIPKLQFSSGAGLRAKKGALGMSLQTPRVLTDADEKLLRSLARGGVPKSTPMDAYAKAVAQTPAGKGAAGYATTLAKDGLRSLHFENHRQRSTWLALTAAEKKQLEAFQGAFEDAEEFHGMELVDVVEGGKVVYLFALWPFGSGALLDAGTTRAIAHVVQHGYASSTPDPVLRKSLAAAYAQARKTMGPLEGVDFRPTVAELNAATPPSATGVALLKAVDKLKWKNVEQEHASAIASLVKLWGQDPGATAKLTALLVDDTLAGHSPVCGRVAGLVLDCCPTRRFASPNQLTPEYREILGVIAAHPRALTSGVSHTNGKHQWPTSPLLFGRWLGLKPSSVINLELKSGETLLGAIAAATHGTGSVEGVAKRIASAVERDRALDLVDDLFAIAHTFTNVADLKIDFGKLTAEGKQLKDLEIARRRARLIELVRRMVVAIVDLPALLAELQAGAHLGDAMACLLLAAHDLAGGKRLDLPSGFAHELTRIANIPDFAEPTRGLLSQAAPRDRALMLMSVQSHEAGAAGRWLYLDLLAPKDLDYLARYYNLLPDDELTPRWLGQASKEEGARLLGILAKQYGEGVEQRMLPGMHLVEFQPRGGKKIALWSAPPLGTLVDRKPWTNKA